MRIMSRILCGDIGLIFKHFSFFTHSQMIQIHASVMEEWRLPLVAGHSRFLGYVKFR